MNNSGGNIFFVFYEQKYIVKQIVVTI